MKVPSRAFPLIIGPKGVRATEITEQSGARFDLDRVKEIAILKGSPEACQKLKELIEEILAEEGLPASQAVEDVPEVRVVDSGHYKDLGPIPGAVYDAAAAAAYKARQADLNMSKSAVRRRKRKEADNGEKEEVVEHKGRNGMKNETAKTMVIPQKKEVVEKRVVNSHVEVSNGHVEEADGDELEADEEHDHSNYSDINIPTPEAEDEEEEEEDEEVLESGITHQYSESTSPDPTLDADSYSGSQLSSGSVEGMGSVDRDSKHIPKGVCVDVVRTPAAEVKVKEVPRVIPAPVSVDIPKTVLAGGKVASSSGLLGMLLGHNGAAPVREEKEKQEATKYSAELEKLLSSLSTSAPPSESSTKSLKASPKAIPELESDGNKGGYYKSKSGFSVRL